MKGGMARISLNYDYIQLLKWFFKAVENGVEVRARTRHMGLTSLVLCQVHLGWTQELGPKSYSLFYKVPGPFVLQGGKPYPSGGRIWGELHKGSPQVLFLWKKRCFPVLFLKDGVIRLIDFNIFQVVKFQCNSLKTSSLRVYS